MRSKWRLNSAEAYRVSLLVSLACIVLSILSSSNYVAISIPSWLEIELFAGAVYVRADGGASVWTTGAISAGQEPWDGIPLAVVVGPESSSDELVAHQRFLGLHFINCTRVQAMGISLWLVIALLGLYQASWLISLRNAYVPVVPRFPAGHCQGCGYSLLGLAGDQCPECGLAFRCSNFGPVRPATTRGQTVNPPASDA